MEILATNVSYGGFIVYFTMMIIILLIALAWIFDAKTKAEYFLYGILMCVTVIGIVLGVLDDSKGVVTYDAIITDWNEVYEQGYEVVETNGKIVTLRKVDE